MSWAWQINLILFLSTRTVLGDIWSNHLILGSLNCTNHDICMNLFIPYVKLCFSYYMMSNLCVTYFLSLFLLCYKSLTDWVISYKCHSYHLLYRKRTINIFWTLNLNYVDLLPYGVHAVGPVTVGRKGKGESPPPTSVCSVTIYEYFTGVIYTSDHEYLGAVCLGLASRLTRNISPSSASLSEIWGRRRGPR